MNIIHKSRVYIGLKELILGQDVFIYLLDKVTREVIYLKVEKISKKTEYFSHDELMKLLPGYNNTQSINQKKVLDAIKTILNKQSSVRVMNNVLNSVNESIKPWGIYFKPLCRLNIKDEEIAKLEEMIANYIIEYKKVHQIEDKPIKKVRAKTLKLILNYPYLNIYTTMISISMVVLITCTYSLVTWYQSGQSSRSIIESALTDVVIMETEVEIDGEELESVDINDVYAEGYDITSNYNSATQTTSNSMYWQFIKTGIINVNFDSLIAKNTDTVGWIQVNNTNINYPIVQTENNDFYLTHSFDKSYNYAGWVFADYRSDFENLKANTVIYGHSRIDKTMFGTLKNTLNEDWYTNRDNQVIKISTPKSNTLWRIFSIYTIDPESYYLSHTFENEKAHQKWLDTITKRSIYNFAVETNINNRVLTLSSCFKKSRVVIHAVLVKSVEK